MWARLGKLPVFGRFGTLPVWINFGTLRYSAVGCVVLKAIRSELGLSPVDGRSWSDAAKTAMKQYNECSFKVTAIEGE